MNIDITTQGQKIITKQWEIYRMMMLSQSKETIFDVAYKISIMSEIYNTILNADDIEMDDGRMILETLCQRIVDGKDTLDTLYFDFMDSEASVDTYDDTLDFFEQDIVYHEKEGK